MTDVPTGKGNQDANTQEGRSHEDREKMAIYKKERELGKKQSSSHLDLTYLASTINRKLISVG